MTYLDDHRQRMRVAIVTTVALHLALAWMLLDASRLSVVKTSVSNAMTVLLLPQRAATRDEPKSETPRSRTTHSIPPEPAASAHSESPPVPLPVERAPQADNTKTPAPAAPDIEALIEHSRGDLRTLDKEWRKEHRKLLELPPNSIQSKLEKGIAKAGAPTIYRTESIYTQDGRVITKVYGSFGVMCYITRGGGDLDGRDPASIRADSVKQFPCSGS